MTKSTYWLAALRFACVLLETAGARADLIAEEPFVYTSGTAVNGQTGGTGWSGGWITQDGAAPSDWKPMPRKRHREISR